MAVYKDKKRGTWYVSLYYTDWTGKQQRKLKRGFSTKKEAQDWERHFSLEKASSLDMTFFLIPKSCSLICLRTAGSRRINRVVKAGREISCLFCCIEKKI